MIGKEKKTLLLLVASNYADSFGLVGSVSEITVSEFSATTPKTTLVNVCGIYSIEKKMTFKNSAATSLSTVPVPVENPQSTLSTVFIGTISSIEN